jgi:hypothetical protein
LVRSGAHVFGLGREWGSAVLCRRATYSENDSVVTLAAPEFGFQVPLSNVLCAAIRVEYPAALPSFCRAIWQVDWMEAMRLNDWWMALESRAARGWLL